MLAAWSSKVDPDPGGGEDAGSGSRLPPAVLICATVSAGLSTILSLVTVWLQLKHYHRPRLQRFVVRILVMVPIYSIASLVSLYSLDLAFFVDAVRDAFVIYCFFSLLVEYLGGERSLIILLHGREPVKHPWPISLFASPMDASDPFTFLGLKRGILQYVQIKPILAFVTVVMKATGTYKDGSLQADAGYTYVSIAYNLSVSISLYALAMFWVATHDDLQPFRPMPKFLSVKGIIFFSFWQGFGVSILVAIGWLHSARYETEKLSLAVQDTLICFEMPLFAFLHLYAFSYTDYIDEAHIFSGRLPVWFAIRDAFGYKDLVLDSLTTVRGTGFSYRTFEPASSTVHSFGPTLDRRLRAGLRYSTRNGKKYWLPQPVTGGTGEEAYSRKGKEAWKTRPLHEARLKIERKLIDERMGYAPVSEAEERDTVHVDPDLLPSHAQGGHAGPESEGQGQVAGWWEGAREYDEIESDDESEPESLHFHEEDDYEEMEEIYDAARTLEFGDWSYPVVDASREHARRRIRDEEDAILSGKIKRRKSVRGNDPSRPLARHRPGSYGAMAENAQAPINEDRPRKHQTSSRSAPSTSTDRPAPIGDSIVTEVTTLVKSALPGVSLDDDEDPKLAKAKLMRGKLRLPFGKKEEKELPPDAIDLVVEDSEAEEEEMLRQRRRGEPTSKRTRVYRKAYTLPHEQEGGNHRERHAQDETVQARDVVARNEDKDGPRERGESLSPQSDEVERVVVKEDERFARQAGVDETPGIDHSDALNPWE
ncbi:OSTA/TMEM184 family protein [Sporobolomyces koalae]|uniref:OSTA/TMEM184 family protein n=1 Tax=Sporobolomyces koalae TaxID=500713 RepID=UPI003179AEBB